MTYTFLTSCLLFLIFALSNEEDDESLTKMESESLVQKFNEVETGITTVIAQAEGMKKKMGVDKGVEVVIEIPGVKNTVWLDVVNVANECG